MRKFQRFFGVSFLAVLLATLFCGPAFSDSLMPTQNAVVIGGTGYSETNLVVAKGADFVIKPTLNIPTAHQGHRGTLYVYAQVGDSFYSMDDMEKWTAVSKDSLKPLKRLTLGSTLTISIISGNFGAFDGAISLYYAYELFDSPLFFGNMMNVKFSDIAANLKEYLDGNVEMGIPGISMAVEIPHEGKWLGTSGLSDIYKGTALTSEDKFRVGSITKTFTSLTVLQLAQEGKINLDASMETYIPGKIHEPYDPSAITVRELLNHTNGIFDYTHDFENLLVPSTLYPTMPWTEEEVLAIVQANEKISEPGEFWSYTSTGFYLLGLIVEEVTGNKWEDEVTNRFIKPLNLTHTSVPESPDTSIPAPYAHGYLDLYDFTEGNVGEEGVLVDYSMQDPSLSWSSGNIISTPEDLIVWINAIGSGKLLNKEYQSELLTYVDAGVNLKFGLGIAYRPLTGTLRHIGGITGYTSVMDYQIEKGFPVAICTNLNSMPVNDIMDYALGIITGVDMSEMTREARSKEPEIVQKW